MAKKKRTLLDAKLEDLEREFARVQQEMHMLSRAVKDPEATARRGLPLSPREEPAEPVRPRSSAPPRAEPVPATAPPAPAVPGPSLAPAPGNKPRPAAAPPARPDDDFFPELARDRQRGRTRENRLAHYLSAGEFAGGVRPRTDRKVMRNKAIFMLVLVLILLYVVVKLLA